MVKTGGNKIMKGRQCDIWAAGVSLYNIACGKLPYQGESRNDIKVSLET
jgi:serine/threonine protein kinase